MCDEIVFVYGTLQRGYGNHRLLESSEYLGNAITHSEYYLTNVGFPYLVDPQDPQRDVVGRVTAPVKGEVYRVTQQAVMDSLDRLEGVPHHYRRSVIPFKFIGSDKIEYSWAYVANCEHAEKAMPCNLEIVEDREVFVWTR